MKEARYAASDHLPVELRPTDPLVEIVAGWAPVDAPNVPLWVLPYGNDATKSDEDNLAASLELLGRMVVTYFLFRKKNPGDSIKVEDLTACGFERITVVCFWQTICDLGDRFHKYLEVSRGRNRMRA